MNVFRKKSWRKTSNVHSTLKKENQGRREETLPQKENWEKKDTTKNKHFEEEREVLKTEKGILPERKR
jgi:hypothetical protein